MKKIAKLFTLFSITYFIFTKELMIEVTKKNTIVLLLECL